LAWAGTVDLLFEMVSAGSLSRDEGGRVWRATFSNRSRWKAYGMSSRHGCAGVRGLVNATRAH
jgi:hypothetical protein